MSAERGYIYGMVNASIPGLIKIGASTKHPLERARELSVPTSVATPFVLAYYRAVAFPFMVEAAIHRQLDACRTNDKREFFRLPLHEAIAVIDQFDEIDDSISTPWAELFATFDDDGSGRKLTDDEQFRCQQLARKLNGKS